MLRLTELGMSHFVKYHFVDVSCQWTQHSFVIVTIRWNNNVSTCHMVESTCHIVEYISQLNTKVYSIIYSYIFIDWKQTDAVKQSSELKTFSKAVLSVESTESLLSSSEFMTGNRTSRHDAILYNSMNMMYTKSTHISPTVIRADIIRECIIHLLSNHCSCFSAMRTIDEHLNFSGAHIKGAYSQVYLSANERHAYLQRNWILLNLISASESYSASLSGLI